MDDREIRTGPEVPAEEPTEPGRGDHARPRRTSDDIIDESSLESFPASDPPAWAGGVTTGRWEPEPRDEDDRPR